MGIVALTGAVCMEETGVREELLHVIELEALGLAVSDWIDRGRYCDRDRDDLRF